MDHNEYHKMIQIYGERVEELTSNKLQSLPIYQFGWIFYCMRPNRHPVYEPREMMSPMLNIDDRFIFVSDDTVIVWDNEIVGAWKRNLLILKRFHELQSSDKYFNQFDVRIAFCMNEVLSLAEFANYNNIVTYPLLLEKLRISFPEITYHDKNWRTVKPFMKCDYGKLIQIKINIIV